jgi:hypothetical protein
VRDIPHPSSPEIQQPPMHWVPMISGGETDGALFDNPIPSNAEVK